MELPLRIVVVRVEAERDGVGTLSIESYISSTKRLFACLEQFCLLCGMLSNHLHED